LLSAQRRPKKPLIKTQLRAPILKSISFMRKEIYDFLREDDWIESIILLRIKPLAYFDG